MNKKLAYIEKGIIRAYTHKQNSDEATLLLRWEDQFVGSHNSILLDKPSNFIYQALEETYVLEIDYSEVERIHAGRSKIRTCTQPRPYVYVKCVPGND
ncbi:hypothetical protein [Flavobacterium sp. NRK1]|uniref:hypothetical protein n=1 Tax=Flavobacterium sp. NRK1 TaxID=2954929 RepID=UPI0035AE06FB